MIRPNDLSAFDVHREQIEGVTPGPWDGWSRLDRLDGLDTRGPAPLQVSVRPVAHRAATGRDNGWGRVASWIALVAAIALMSSIVAAVLLGSVGGL